MNSDLLSLNVSAAIMQWLFKEVMIFPRTKPTWTYHWVLHIGIDQYNIFAAFTTNTYYALDMDCL